MDLKNSAEPATAVATGRLSRAVWVAMAVYACVLAILGIDRFMTYRAGLDLGLFTQSVADAAHGFHNVPEGGSHYVRHFSPILWAAAPLLFLTRSPIGLIVTQAVAGALCAAPIYLIARRRMDARLASLVAIVALAYPPLVGVTFTDFHENGLAPAIVAWLLWAVDGRRFGFAALFAALALCVKEDEALIGIVLGTGYFLYCVYRKDRPGAIFGAAVGLASAFVLVGFFAVVRPWAGATQPWTPLNFYLVSRPGEATGLASVWFHLSFLLEALLPLLFLPLRSPVFVLAIPGLVEALSSRWSIVYTMGQHYPGVWIAYVLVAFVCALAVIAKQDRARAERLTKLSLLVCGLVLVFASPTHWAHFLGIPTAHQRVLDRTLARIPADASVGAVDEVYAHLSLDPNAQPGYAGDIHYLVVDERYDSPTWRATYRPQVDEKLRSGSYELVSDEDGVRLYRSRK